MLLSANCRLDYRWSSDVWIREDCNELHDFGFGCPARPSGIYFAFLPERVLENRQHLLKVTGVSFWCVHLWQFIQ